VEIHAEGGEGHRRRRGLSRAGREVRAGERELQAGGQRGAERQQKIRLISWKWPLPTLIVARAEVVVDVATRER
jgi:hypothetical protein